MEKINIVIKKIEKLSIANSCEKIKITNILWKNIIDSILKSNFFYKKIYKNNLSIVAIQRLIFREIDFVKKKDPIEYIDNFCEKNDSQNLRHRKSNDGQKLINDRIKKIIYIMKKQLYKNENTLTNIEKSYSNIQTIQVVQSKLLSKTTLFCKKSEYFTRTKKSRLIALKIFIYLLILFIFYTLFYFKNIKNL
jgi:hypothetical protein